MGDMKDTLKMGSTAFEMRGNLPLKEPKRLEEWDKMHLYETLLKEREGAKEYVLHDGPPYANGDIHCGHMMNRLLKDFVIRSKSMEGYRTPFVFGWDTHGLPIEVQVAKSGVDRKKLSVAEFRQKCREYALKQVEHQKEQIHRLGLLGDFSNPYLTLDKKYEADQVRLFGKLAREGVIYKGVKPVYWSPSSESALAEAEVEYKDVPARTIYVRFALKENHPLVPASSYVLIWTTTPWTIPADLAITLNPKFTYGFYETDYGTLLFLTDRAEALKEELGLTRCELLATYKGKQLEGIEAIHPLYPERVSPLIVNSYVTSDAGTGCVHTAPDHGVDDFNACAPYGIRPFCPVDEEGVLHLKEGDPLNGLFYEEANDKVVELLEENGSLIKEIDIVHSYPHDWRTHKPVIFRATPQWFCSISPLEEKLLAAIKEVEWTPKWGEEKMRNMIKDRSDWCISRQRSWGVPLPILYHADKTPILDEDVIEHIAKIFEEEGSDVWFSKEASYFLPEEKKEEGVSKEKDIMDVWFDSGSSWMAVLKGRGLKEPCDLYLEGNDQYRGWFNSSLTLSVALTGKPSFQHCLTHGWVMDESWKKMSKSAGNGIDPSKVAGEFGADLLRLWCAGVNYQSDVRIGESVMKAVSDQYRKIRNVLRFLLGALDGYEGETSEETPLLDKWVREDFQRLINEVLTSYDHFAFPTLLQNILNFIVDISGFFLDASKDILYCDALSSKRRKARLETIFFITKGLILLLAPILPFTMEEAYRALPLSHPLSSVALEKFPSRKEVNEETLQEYALFRSLRDNALKALEEARSNKVIGSSIEAELLISEKGKEFAFLSQMKEELPSLLMVSEVTLKEGETSYLAKKKEGEKCERCRLTFSSLEKDEEGHALCPRCKEALKEIHHG